MELPLWRRCLIEVDVSPFEFKGGSGRLKSFSQSSPIFCRDICIFFMVVMNETDKKKIESINTVKTFNSQRNNMTIDGHTSYCSFIHPGQVQLCSCNIYLRNWPLKLMSMTKAASNLFTRTTRRNKFDTKFEQRSFLLALALLFN